MSVFPEPHESTEPIEHEPMTREEMRLQLLASLPWVVALLGVLFVAIAKAEGREL